MKKYLYLFLSVYCIAVFGQSYPIPLANDYVLVYEFHGGLAKVRNENLWGFIDTTGKEIVPCKYESVENVSSGLAIVKANRLYGAINSKGGEVIPCKYNELTDFRNGFAAFALTNAEGFAKHGIIDSTGKIIIPCQYDEISHYHFSEGFAVVKLDKKYGLINRKGEVIIDLAYNYITKVSEGLFCVTLTGTPPHAVYELQYGLINQAGEEVIPCKYAKIWDFYEGLAAVQHAKKWGFINKEGKEVIPCKYDNVNSFQEGFAWVVLNNKTTFIDKTGKEIIPFQYNASFWEDRGTIHYDPLYFYEGVAQVKSPNNDKFGFIDTTGKVIISFEYDKANGFDNNIAAVAKKGAWALIDKQGKAITPFCYERIRYFYRKDAIEVERYGERQFINRQGKELTQGKYDAAWYAGGLLIHVKLNGKQGFIDAKGKEVVPIIYERTSDFSEGIIAVKKDKKWHLIRY